MALGVCRTPMTSVQFLHFPRCLVVPPEGVRPGRVGQIKRWTKVSRNSQLYSDPQTIYTLRVKKGHTSKAVIKLKLCTINKDKQCVVATGFSIEAYKGYFKHLIE